jgi:hypothetical protein
MKFKDILESFKKDESAEYIMPLTEDKALRNGILAWNSMPVKLDIEKDCPEDILNNRKLQWEWMWDSISYDIKRFSVIMSCKEYEVVPIVTRLRSLYLIYPDGTINEMAKKYLKGIVISKFLKQQGKKKKEEE